MWRLPPHLIPAGSAARYVSHNFQRFLALDGSTVGQAEIWSGEDRSCCMTLTQVIHLQACLDGTTPGAGIEGLQPVVLAPDPDLIDPLKGIQPGNPIGVRVGSTYYVFSRSGMGAATPFCERDGQQLPLADIPPDDLTELLRVLRGFSMPFYDMTVRLPAELSTPVEHRHAVYFHWGTFCIGSQRHCAALTGYDNDPVFLPEGRWADCPSALREALIAAVDAYTGRPDEPAGLVATLKQEALTYLRS